MEQQPQHGGEQQDAVNSYGTDDPARQAAIEAARTAATIQRRRDRAELEQLVVAGMDPDEAEALIEFNHYARDREPDASTVAPDAEIPATSEQSQPRYEPRIYVADEASLARGIQHGLWIDADQGADDLDADIAAMLDSSPTVGAQGWAIRDYDGFAGVALDEHASTSLIATLAKGVAEFGAAYAAYVKVVGTEDPDLLDRFEDFYVGTYASPEAWAKAAAEDLEWPRQLDEAITDPFLRRYLRIDYALMAKESRHSWDVVEGSDGETHVFMR